MGLIKFMLCAPFSTRKKYFTQPLWCYAFTLNFTYADVIILTLYAFQRTNGKKYRSETIFTADWRIFPHM